MAESVTAHDNIGDQVAHSQRSILHIYGYNRTHTSQYNFSMPDLHRYAVCISTMLAVYAMFDFFVARRTKARYFAIHVLANSVVVVTTVQSLFWIITDPLRAFASEQFSYWAFAANLAIHIYHVAAFNDLIWIDWLHHGIMTGLFSPGIMTVDKILGPILDANNFFLCGLPGGLDYAMLFAVKHGWMHPLTEKKHNATLNTWIRAPGSVMCCAWSWVVIFAKNPLATAFHPARLIEFSLVAMSVWNVQFFMSRVVANYHVRRYQAEERKRQEKENGVGESRLLSNGGQR